MKKIYRSSICVCIALMVLISSILATVTINAVAGGTVKTGLVNLAIGKTTEASAVWPDPGYEGNKAIDGNQDTRWAAVFSNDNQYLIVDLGKNYSIWETKISFEFTDGDKSKYLYKIEGSVDKASWFDYATSQWEIGTVGTKDDLNMATAKYMKVTVKGGGQFASIREFQILGDDVQFTSQEVANQITLSDCTVGVDKLVLPTVPIGFTRTIKTTTPSGIINADGTVTRPLVTSTVNVILSVKDVNGISADTQSIPVRVCSADDIDYVGNLMMKIKDIPRVLSYNDNKDTLVELESLYNQLTDEKKLQVTNYDVLKNALVKIDSLKFSPITSGNVLWQHTSKADNGLWTVIESSPYGTTEVSNGAFHNIDHCVLSPGMTDFGENGSDYLAFTIMNDSPATRDLEDFYSVYSVEVKDGATVKTLIATRPIVGTDSKTVDQIVELNATGKALRGQQNLQVWFGKFSDLYGMRIGVKSDKPYTDDPMRVNIWYNGKLSSWIGETKESVNTDLVADLDAVYHEPAKNLYMQRPIDSSKWKEITRTTGAIVLRMYLSKDLSDKAAVKLTFSTGKSGTAKLDINLTQSKLKQGWNDIVVYLSDLGDINYESTDWMKLSMTGNDSDVLIALSRADLVDMSKGEAESDLLIPPFDTTGEDENGNGIDNFTQDDTDSVGIVENAATGATSTIPVMAIIAMASGVVLSINKRRGKRKAV
jgi:hypothetical protein